MQPQLFTNAEATYKPAATGAGVADTSEPRQHLLAVDGNSLAHRAYHAYKPTRRHTPNWTHYGFVALLIGILDKTQAPRLIIGFDSQHNHRKQQYPQYKTGRKTKEQELVDQLQQLPHITQQLGLHTVTIDGHEADDIVASAAHAAAVQHSWDTVVATSDRDAYQTIDDTTTVLRLGNGLHNATRITSSWLTTNHNIPAGRYLEYAALRGDRSDNLPGINGVGEKTAAIVVNAARHTDHIYDNPDKYRNKLGNNTITKMLNGEANYRRNMELMKLRTDLPTELHKSGLPEDTEQTAHKLAEVQLPQLMGRAHKLCGPRNDQERNNMFIAHHQQQPPGGGGEHNRQQHDPNQPVFNYPPDPDPPF